MRAKEFIKEAKQGKIAKRQQSPSRGIHKFSDAEHWNGDYKMYRMGLALACTDGDSDPDIDYETFVGRWKMAYPYSEVEAKMLKKAYKATKTEYIDVNKGDMRSIENDGTNKSSPISGFKGFKK